MDRNNLMREQSASLAFESLLISEVKKKRKTGAASKTALLAGLAALAPAAAQAGEKLGSDKPLAMLEEARSVLENASSASNETLVRLAEIIFRGHAEIETMAETANLALMRVGGGTPKPPPERVIGFVQSVLGIG